jgi:hypothetical protein
MSLIGLDRPAGLNTLSLDMGNRKLTQALAPRICCAALVGLVALVAGGCGSTAQAPPGLSIAGAGLQAGEPPWSPEYAHLAQRLHQLDLPPGGKETFHIHALLHIYVNGLLSPVPENVGRDPAKGLESSLHTHDRTGVIHMDASHPYNFTLGDFFAVWGVKLGPAQLGGLTGLGDDHLHFYLDGKRLSDPAAHVLHNNDSVVIGYGADSSFPHTPSTILLKEVEGKGGTALSCSSAPSGHRTRSCLAAPKPQASPSPHKAR